MSESLIAPGCQVNQFLLLEPLGQGGAATVFRAQNTESGEDCAIKFLFSHAVSSETMQRRFLREIAVMQRLDHENLVRVFEGGLFHENLYCVMELVDSGTLKDYMTRPLPWREVVECAIQVASGLAVVHEQGSVHRDLKPGNIFLASDGRVKIGDFGLVLDPTSSRLTTEGMTVGTVLYMSPEQITGQRELTGAADLYAFGCLIYEMLTGTAPFSGDVPALIIEAQLTADPPPLQTLATDCPSALEQLVKELMQKKVSDRPASAALVRQRLEQMLDGNAEVAQESAPSENEDEGPSPEVSRQPNLTERLQEHAATKSVSTAALVILATVVGLAVLLSAMLQNG